MDHDDAVAPLAGRVADQPVSRILERRPQDKHVAACDCRIVGKGQHVHAFGGCSDPGCVRSFGIERAQNDFGPVIDGRCGLGRGGLRISSGAINAQIDLHTVQAADGKARRVFEVLGEQIVAGLA